MEKQSIQDLGEMEIEEFPDDFQCCVCLDLMYKPVVLACGHISCFWCVFKAMDTYQESHCPICRNPYNHFPRICRLMHFLLLKLYPSAYERRERQVAEEENKYGYRSPQFQDDLLDSPFNKVLDVRDTSSPLVRVVSVDPNSTSGYNSLVQDSSEINSPCEVNATASLMTQISETTNEVNCTIKQDDRNGICKQVSVTDLQCAVCMQLLFRPIVLNCGDVYCEACINKPRDSVFRCPLCQSPHPNGFPNVCLVLDHFLEEHFAEEYSARRESLSKSQNASTSGSSMQTQEQAAQKQGLPGSPYYGPRLDLHHGVGCDYCGVCPIVGVRYKCKDCVEKIGFDLCEDCYLSSSKLPGRFNQQHTQEHRFESIPASYLQVSLMAHEDVVSGEYIRVFRDHSGNVFTMPNLSNNASDDDLENEPSANSSSDDQDNHPAT
ncbi:hypothetical protein BUALT_Bualt14G0039000 [Buddleja alternifolia]|uniref:E3 ubiquitin-protein ligase PRT1 n=1 Tax=Buddleja alternifolia TaxID=168488 RepID=A0AAV6WLC0_9LAMI|nr:hypothetical protein BUALT_Bualt14G0039000 [Buddleja alternifolia]